ncbi:MAG: CoA transferase [Dehalococcoidia bacterium]|nr:CoA transferase [Dehalococcoidia bacterium]
MSGTRPLRHIRATVLTQAWAGAFTTRLLADMGAEVIQVESLNRIDPWRGGYPPRLSGTYPDRDPGERPFDRNAAYNSVNTGKKAITLDLNHSEAMDAFLELVSVSDIVAENFSGRVLPNLGLEYPVLRSVNPSVILLRMPAYGVSGPYANYMGNGGTIEPMSGITSLLGYEGGPPMNSGVMHTDPFAGLMGMAGLMIALHHRTRTGRGQEIDLSQQETSISLIPDHIMAYTMSGQSPQRCGNRYDRMAPHNNYRCKGNESWVAIAVRSEAEWIRFCAAMGRPELASDHRFRDLSARLDNIEELDRIVSEWTRDKDAYHVADTLQSQSIPSAPVMKAAELLHNPQLKARGFFETLEREDTGPLPYAGPAWRLSDTPGILGSPPPGLGQHSEEVLREILGMPTEMIQDLAGRFITGDTPPSD